MRRATKELAGTIVFWLEIILAGIVAVAIVVSLIHSLGFVQSMDWTSIDAFYELLNRLLLVVIGLEFIHMLVARDLVSVLELFAFIVARKMLKPDISSLDLALGALAFVTLIAARYGISHYHHKTGNDDISTHKD